MKLVEGSDETPSVFAETGRPLLFGALGRCAAPTELLMFARFESAVRLKDACAPHVADVEAVAVPQPARPLPLPAADDAGRLVPFKQASEHAVERSLHHEALWRAVCAPASPRVSRCLPTTPVAQERRTA
eukprot:6213819-Pleurochrysis_carterae.AAC.3